MRRQIIPILMMAAAILACNVGSTGDTQATVQAAYATLTADAESAGGPLDKGDETPQSVPTEGPTPTEPQATTVPTDAPTPQPTATPPETRSGPVTEVPACENDIDIDADAADWASQSSRMTLEIAQATFGAGNWGGVGDASAEASLCWTSEALYIYVEVTDDVHSQTQRGATAYQGDEIEISFDTDLRGDYYRTSLSSDDTQFGLSPGNFDELPPSVVIFTPTLDTTSNVDIAAAQPGEAGYVIEAAIPWAELGVLPNAGEVLGMCVNVSDNDRVGEAAQESYVSHCGGLNVFNPTTYASMRLLP